MHSLMSFDVSESSDIFFSLSFYRHYHNHNLHCYQLCCREYSNRPTKKAATKKPFISINVHFSYTISPFSHGCWYSSKIHLWNIILLDWYEYLCSCQCLHFINHRYHFLGESSPISRMITFYLSHFFFSFSHFQQSKTETIEKHR